MSRDYELHFQGFRRDIVEMPKAIFRTFNTLNHHIRSILEFYDRNWGIYGVIVDVIEDHHNSRPTWKKNQ